MATAKKPDDLPPLMTIGEIHARYKEAFLIDCEHTPDEETDASTARVVGHGETLAEAAKMAHAAGFMNDEALRFWLFWPQQEALFRAKGYFQ